MSIQDRDWYWEDYKKKETDYDGDFSLHSKKKKGVSSSVHTLFFDSAGYRCSASLLPKMRL